MKVSEITTKNLADYLRLDYDSMTADEITELATLLGVAKEFIKSYTGLKDIVVTGEIIGTGDGETKVFFLNQTRIVSESETIYVNGTAQARTTDYSLDCVSGETNFVTAPIESAVITADYQCGIDAYNDFVIVVYILVQDMYDNRSMYVEKSNLNKVVDTILGMHSVNLL